MVETIGQQLKNAREARSLTFNKVTQATHIQARLLEAMEADDFESLPSPVQARAFLRLYVKFLELNLDDLIARQRGTVASQIMEPAPDQVQTPGTAPETTATVELADELPAGKSPALFR